MGRLRSLCRSFIREPCVSLLTRAVLPVYRDKKRDPLVKLVPRMIHIL